MPFLFDLRHRPGVEAVWILAVYIINRLRPSKWTALCLEAAVRGLHVPGSLAFRQLFTVAEAAGNHAGRSNKSAAGLLTQARANWILARAGPAPYSLLKMKLLQ